jgi:hypothetical protein
MVAGSLKAMPALATEFHWGMLDQIHCISESRAAAAQEQLNPAAA